MKDIVFVQFRPLRKRNQRGLAGEWDAGIDVGLGGDCGGRILEIYVYR